jgi:hypothetical protein
MNRSQLDVFQRKKSSGSENIIMYNQLRWLLGKLEVSRRLLGTRAADILQLIVSTQDLW